MPGPRYNTATRAYAATVATVGLLAGVHLILRADTARWPPFELIVFGGFALTTTLLTITVQGLRPSKGSLSVSSAAIYALLFLIDPAAVALVLTAMVLTDWLGNRRSVLPGLFNTGQSLASLWVALRVWNGLGPEDGVLGPDLRGLLAGAASVAVYALVNHLLTTGVLVLASGTSVRGTGVFGTTAVFNEILLACFGLSMAYLWGLSPPLVLVGIVPPVLLFTVLGTLHHREELLEARRAELASIQQLGLEIGSKLDVDQLSEVVVRIAAEALHASGSVLAMVSEDGEDLQLLACRHPDSTFRPPARLPCRGFTVPFFERREA